MGVFSSIALGVAAAASVASAGVGYIQQSKQARLQKKAASAQRKQQEVAVRRQHRGAIRQAQIARAQATAAGGAAGVGPIDSAMFGGQGSLTSQLGSGLGYSTQQGNISDDIAGYQTKSNAVGVQFGGIQAALGAVNTAAQFGYNYFKPKEVAAAAAKAAESRIQTAKNRRNYGPSGFFT